jgi:uncharacterized membrane protein
MKFIRQNILPFGLLITLIFTWSSARADAPIIHAVLFYSPTCPHCHKVITEDLTPLVEEYREQLFLIAIDVSVQQGSALYHSAIDHYHIPEDRLGVPTLIVGDQVLVGSVEIPSLFPGIVENGIASGGIDWPMFPGLWELLALQGLIDPESNASNEGTQDGIPGEQTDEEMATVDNPTNGSLDSSSPQEPAQSEDQSNLNSGVENMEASSNSSSGQEVAPNKINDDELNDESTIEAGETGITNDLEQAASISHTQTLAQRFARDKTGNTVSVIVLLVMVFSVIGVGAVFFDSKIQPKKWPNWSVLTLLIIGTGVAIYMGYVEVTHTAAVCGPVGDCNTVQQSAYASLFGTIPIGILGVFGYLVIGLNWLLLGFGPEKWQKFFTLCLLALTLFGTLFSIYLTFLEPFVIGATCAWCLTSAIVMTLLLWVAIEPAVRVLRFSSNNRR